MAAWSAVVLFVLRREIIWEVANSRVSDLQRGSKISPTAWYDDITTKKKLIIPAAPSHIAHTRCSSWRVGLFFFLRGSSVYPLVQAIKMLFDFIYALSISLQRITNRKYLINFSPLGENRYETRLVSNKLRVGSLFSPISLSFKLHVMRTCAYCLGYRSPNSSSSFLDVKWFFSWRTIYVQLS